MTINKELQEELKNKLLEEKERLENELSRFADPEGKSGEYKTRYEDVGSSRDDNASEVEAYSDNLALEDTLEKELKKVNGALERLENGTYGFCSNCNKEIGEDRLKAYPAANTCIKC